MTSTTYIDYTKHVWQYSGGADWQEIIQWCKTTYGNRYWTNYCETIMFANEQDYNWFKLRWGSQ